MYFDYTYIVFVLPALILSLWAQFMVKSRFAQYSRVTSHRRLTGAEAAALLLRANGITDVEIRHIRGSLTDNYNSGTKVLSLSDSTYASTSIAAVGVAAHETGHAIQHQVGYGPLVLRSTLVPAANIGSRFGPALAFLGIMLSFSTRDPSLYTLWYYVAVAGIVLFSGAVLFYLVTLPVEFDASFRALKILRQTGALDESELDGVKKVLTAAAMTYVASALSAIGNLVRLMVLNSRRDRR